MNGGLSSVQTASMDRERGAPEFDPICEIHAVQQSDHNLLTNELQLTAVRTPTPIDSATRLQPGDSKTHNLYAESMPMTGYAALARVVAGWPGLSPEEQQRILEIARGTSPAWERKEIV